MSGCTKACITIVQVMRTDRFPVNVIRCYSNSRVNSLSRKRGQCMQKRMIAPPSNDALGAIGDKDRQRKNEVVVIEQSNNGAVDSSTNEAGEPALLEGPETIQSHQLLRNWGCSELYIRVGDRDETMPKRTFMVGALANARTRAMLW